MKAFSLKLSLIVATITALSSCAPRAVVVRSRPAPPIIVRPLSPGPAHVWVDGDWYLRGNQYVYRQGYWTVPKRRNAYRVPGHWKNTRRGSYWVPGRWR